MYDEVNMQISVKHSDWRVLRTLVRAKGRPVVGSKLRLEMSRLTKDGSFLTTLVRDGLLKVAAPADTPFTATYTLTDLGKEAAEYGVYDVDWEALKKSEEPAPAPPPPPPAKAPKRSKR